ncbi:MAG: hypothetical protein ACKVOP_06990 [Sphingomonadaceae bacterium]
MAVLPSHSWVARMQILVVLRVFAFILFLFVPSIAVMLFLGFVVRDTNYFVGFGLTTLLGNGVLLFLPPFRAMIGDHLQAIAGTRQPRGRNQ